MQVPNLRHQFFPGGFVRGAGDDFHLFIVRDKERNLQMARQALERFRELALKAGHGNAAVQKDVCFFHKNCWSFSNRLADDESRLPLVRGPRVLGGSWEYNTSRPAESAQIGIGEPAPDLEFAVRTASDGELFTRKLHRGFGFKPKIVGKVIPQAEVALEKVWGWHSTMSRVEQFHWCGNPQPHFHDTIRWNRETLHHHPIGPCISDEDRIAALSDHALIGLPHFTATGESGFPFLSVDPER